MSRLACRVTLASLLVAIALTSAGCGGSEQCKQLQGQFDQAEDSGAFSAMQTTDRKMAATGCYD